MIDATSRYPLAPSVPRSQDQEDLLINADTEKTDKYLGQCESNGCGFGPFAISTFGALGPSSGDFLFDLETLYASSEPSKEALAALRYQLWQGLQIALKCEVARMLLGGASSPPVLPGSDQVYPPSPR